MKFSADRKALHEAIQRVGSVISSSAYQPLYQNVRMEALDNMLMLSATDLEVALQLKVSAEVEEAGIVLLPHSRIAPLLAATPDERVTLQTDDGAVLLITSDSKIRLLSENPTDFPMILELPVKNVRAIDREVLQQGLHRVAFAAASEKGRYALNGVLFAVTQDGDLELVAADGARLALSKQKVENPGGLATSFIVMNRGIQQLAKLAGYGTSLIRFNVTSSQFIAENDVGRLVCQLVEGQFPNYAEVIPQTSKIKVTVPTKELLSAVKRASYMTTDQTRVVDFAFSPGSLGVTAESPDIGQGVITLVAEYDGEATSIAFNPTFIEDVLAVVGRETVKMRFNAANAPCVIEAGLGYTYVVSPVIRENAE